MFLSDEIIQAYETEPGMAGSRAVGELLMKKFPDYSIQSKTDAKRIVNAFNLAVDQITKKHGHCWLKKQTFETLFEIKKETS